MWLSHQSHFYSWIKWELDEINLNHTIIDAGFPGGSYSKESAYNEGDLGSITGLGRSARGGHDIALQNSCLKNPRERRRLAGFNPWGHKESDMTE